MQRLRKFAGKVNSISDCAYVLIRSAFALCAVFLLCATVLFLLADRTTRHGFDLYMTAMVLLESGTVPLIMGLIVSVIAERLGKREQ